MNYLTSGIRKTIDGIQKHKLLFILLILLQVVISGTYIVLAVTYPAQILADISGIVEPLQNANYNTESLQQGAAFTSDFAKISLSYNLLVQHTLQLILIVALVTLVLQGIFWVLTNLLLHTEHTSATSKADKLDRLFKMGTKYIAAFVALWIIPFMIIFGIIKSVAWLGIQSISYLYLALAIILVFYYLQSCAFAVIAAPTWKKFLHAGWIVSIKRIYKTIPVMLINLLILAGVIIAAMWSMNYEDWFWLTFLLSLLAILLVPVLKLFFTACMHQIVEQENKSDNNNNIKE